MAASCTLVVLKKASGTQRPARCRTSHTCRGVEMASMRPVFSSTKATSSTAASDPVPSHTCSAPAGVPPQTAGINHTRQTPADVFPAAASTSASARAYMRVCISCPCVSSSATATHPRSPVSLSKRVRLWFCRSAKVTSSAGRAAATASTCWSKIRFVWDHSSGSACKSGASARD